MALVDEQMAALGQPGNSKPLVDQFYDQISTANQPQLAQVRHKPSAYDQAVAAGAKTTDELRAEQARLEAEHGKTATFASNLARGALDFVLAPAALLGLQAEAVGSITGWDGLRDFGREYGEAAQGSEAMATLFSAGQLGASLASGETNAIEKAETAYNKTANTISEQQKAWPMLSTVSHVAGTVAAGLGVGSLAGAGESVASGAARAASTPLTRIGTAAGIGAYENAAAGAQAGYAEHRPLRDVLGSSVMGGLIGAATGGVFQGAIEGVRSPAFAEGLRTFAKERTSKAIGVLKSDVVRMGGKEETLRMADDVANYTFDDGSSVFPKSILKAGTISQEEIAQKVALGREEIGRKVGEMRRTASEFIDASAPDLRPKIPSLVDRIKKEALDELDNSPILKTRGNDIHNTLKELVQEADGDSISINSLRKVQEHLKAKTYPPKGGPVPESKEAMQRVERIFEDAIEESVDKAMPQMGKAEAGAYRDLRRMSQSFIQADDVTKRALSGELGNRAISLSDTLAGTAALAGDIASGGAGVGSIVKGLASAVAHKYAREHGSAFLAALANKAASSSEKFSRALAGAAEKVQEVGINSEAEWLGMNAHDAALTGAPIFIGGLLNDAHVISVDAAGGREAQSVIGALARAKLQVDEHVEAAGPNPMQRQAAQRLAMGQVSAALAAKAGEFDPMSWAKTMPNALQKVLYRGPLLDQISSDIARDTSHVASLKPSPDFDLNMDRIKKLTKDANGPAAIGNIQQAVRELALNAPETPTGDQIRQVARETLRHLSASDVPDAMNTGHNLARTLSKMSDDAADEITKAYIARQVNQLAEQLSSPALGKAGELYGRLTKQTDQGYQQLMDPQQVRAALAKADSIGALPGALKELSAAIIAAHDAKKQFTGEGPDRTLPQQLKAVEQRLLKAEEAATLDGGPAARVLDFFSGKNGNDATGLKGAPQQIVLNAVRPQMERLLPSLGKTDRYTGDTGKPTKSLPKSSSELQSLYSDRMQFLAQSVSSPNPEAIAHGLRGMPNVPPDIQAAVGSETQERLERLLNDMPKATANIRGKAFETLSTDDLRRANAMWEATVKPMSVFSDFHSGAIDYDKVQYAWKQYPGLQQAVQAGLMDAIHYHLDDSQRAKIPDATLTQLDYLLGFNGALQTSVDRGFSARMSSLAQAEQNQPKQGGQLELETSKPTFTERLAEGRQ